MCCMRSHPWLCFVISSWVHFVCHNVTCLLYNWSYHFYCRHFKGPYPFGDEQEPKEGIMEDDKHDNWELPGGELPSYRWTEKMTLMFFWSSLLTNELRNAKSDKGFRCFNFSSSFFFSSRVNLPNTILVDLRPRFSELAFLGVRYSCYVAKYLVWTDSSVVC